MSTVLAHESELGFEMGGPAYRLMQRIGLIKGEGPCIGRRFVAFVLITWVPLLVLSLIEGRAMGATPRESFLLDFATYARFFLAIPLLFVAEAVAGPRLRAAGLHFVKADFIRPADLPAVEAAVVRTRQRREALLPELIFLGIAVFGAWFTVEAWTGSSASASWNSVARPDGTGLSLTGLWYYVVAVPVLQFFGFRWVWRLVIWTLFLREMARLDLATVPTHADGAGGLGFLGAAHLSIAIFPFAASCILSAHVAFQLYFESASIEAFKGLLVVYLIAVEVICLGPLMLFVPLLARTRRQGLREYSVLADSLNRNFEQKWVRGKPADEQFLGSADISSVCDYSTCFKLIQDMRVIPFTRQQVVQIAVVAMLPCLPLAFLVLPIGELLKLLAKALV